MYFGFSAAVNMRGDRGMKRLIGEREERLRYEFTHGRPRQAWEELNRVGYRESRAQLVLSPSSRRWLLLFLSHAWSDPVLVKRLGPRRLLAVSAGRSPDRVSISLCTLLLFV